MSKRILIMIDKKNYSVTCLANGIEDRIECRDDYILAGVVLALLTEKQLADYYRGDVMFYIAKRRLRVAKVFMQKYNK